jgi:hypothetical protein
MEHRFERAEEARIKKDVLCLLNSGRSCRDDSSSDTAVKKAIMLEEEKSTFASHVSSLKTQIAAGLESRIESLQ